ncbi:hypothetical protein J5X98_11085 [Leptothermofonsia sichuanensis E412]|uniref:hypothetical protein n=1 Tax=Leptothermofonsia sichuanensis TaxID=2917832 RepID=UPI001CA60080|nr:hypothetical protein [Leptothermofonsia sichuanensis]QZZ22835.1 hypothetical protein J5X98_11085 [Leptothermofonsia sichuanensis E412]
MLIADDSPELSVEVGVAKDEMNRAKALAFMQLDVVKAEGFTPLQMEVFDTLSGYSFYLFKGLKTQG